MDIVLLQSLHLAEKASFSISDIQPLKLLSINQSSWKDVFYLILLVI